MKLRRQYGGFPPNENREDFRVPHVIGMLSLHVVGAALVVFEERRLMPLTSFGACRFGVVQ